MNRFIKRGSSALVATAVSVMLTAGVAGASGSAHLENGPQPDSLGLISQTASNNTTTDQQSSADASSRQKNFSAPVSLWSVWSNSGDVDQSNSASNTALSGNDNSTDQTIHQGAWQQVEGDGWDAPKPHSPKPYPMPSYTMPDMPAPGYPQGIIDQDAANGNETTQKSSADASSTQSNVNLPISILSAGSNNGDVDQSNKATNTALSGNANSTNQTIGQNAGQHVDGDGTPGHDPKPHEPKPHGPKPHEPKPHEPKPHEPKPHEPKPDGHEYDGHEYDNGDSNGTISQDATNNNETTQKSSADASSTQSNVNLPISILSVHSNNGDVDQSNKATNTAVSGNANSTDQGIDQDAKQKVDGGGSGWGGKNDGATGTVDQGAENNNTTEQKSSAEASSKQTNINLPISILSVGSNNGDVDQSNSAKNTAVSGNANSTDQGIDQDAKQKVDGEGTADADQQASNSNTTEQKSSAEASSNQVNINAPISILSVGSNNGDVDQSNHANNGAGSFNSNSTTQMIGQLVGQTG